MLNNLVKLIGEVVFANSTQTGGNHAFFVDQHTFCALVSISGRKTGYVGLTQYKLQCVCPCHSV